MKINNNKVLFSFETDYGITLNLIPDTEKLMELTGLNYMDSLYFAMRAVVMNIHRLEEHIEGALVELHKLENK